MLLVQKLRRLLEDSNRRQIKRSPLIPSYALQMDMTNSLTTRLPMGGIRTRPRCKLNKLSSYRKGSRDNRLSFFIT